MLPLAALKPPCSARDFDPCVSFLQVLDVISVRGGGGDNNHNNNNNDWSRHHFNSDRSTMDHDDSDSYGGGGDHDQRQGTTSSSRRTNHASRRRLPNMLQTVDRKTGLMLLVSGLSVTFLGVTLFFNKMIIRLGHLLCIAGILLSMGLSQTIQYFVQPKKLRATICLGIGLFLVLMGSPILGMALEIFGILNLFGNMFPIVMMMMKQMPIIGTMFKSTNGNNNNNNSKNNNRNNYRPSRQNNNDDYYDNRHDSYRRPASPHSYDYDPRDDEYAREDDDGLGRRY